MDKKYVVIGGEVRSTTDGEWHWVSAQRLCKLYKINPRECYLVNTEEGGYGLSRGLPVLRPRTDGNYKL